MKKYTAAAFFFFAAAAFAGPLQGQTNPAVPSYYSLLDFNLTSPGAYSTAIGGFANPAVYKMLPGSELQYFWSDESARINDLRRWGLFFGTESLGFGAAHSRVILPSGEYASITDYRLALSFGNKNHSIGLGYGWVGGDREKSGRTSIMQIGAVRRFGRFLSFGIAGAFSTARDERTGLVDIAIRPLGSSKLALFADAEMDQDTRAKDARWSAGAMAEFMPGLNIIGRYFDDESFSVALGFSFGHTGGSASSRFDKNGDLGQTLYGVRLGYNERNMVDEYLEKEKFYLSLTLKGPVKYLKYRYFDDGRTFYKIIETIEEARRDPRISGVALNLSGARMSQVKAWEIKEKLQELRKDGKHVVVFIDQAGMTLYRLACAADRIVMDSDGDLSLPGYLAGRTYLKNLLVKLGLGFDEWRFFKYKSAFETVSRETMSDADREQYFALIEDEYASMKEDVTLARNVSPEEFDAWINEIVLFSPDLALEKGLVDKLGRWEDVKKVIEELEGSKKKYVSPRQLAGRQFPSKLWSENPRIAIVYGLGVCDMDTGIKARALEKVFHQLRDDGRVKAVVFRVDSPGGDGMASDVVAEALRLCSLKKPVIVTQGAVAGSGGYWISMYADTILACPATITGSIGVIGGWVWDKGFGEKLGLTADHIKIGDHADIGFGVRVPFLGLRVPARNLDDEERSLMKKFILQFYDEFVKKVAEGRDMSEEEIGKIAQGRVWSGLDGRDIGLVDMIGGLDRALKIAREAAGFESGEEVDIVEYPRKGLFNLSFLKGSQGFPFSLSGLSGKKDAESYDGYEEVFLQRMIESKGRPLYMVPPQAIPR